MRGRRWILPLLAVVATAAAVAFTVFAVDVLRVSDQVTRDDVRFRTRPTIPSGLWDRVGFLPGGIARRAVGLDDDLAYRRAMWLVGRVRPGTPASQLNPNLEGLRGSAEAQLTEASRKEKDPVRRSEILNLLGVLAMDRYTSDPGNREAIIRNAVGLFQSAVETDPDNQDAKFNLELVLRDFYVAVAPGETPDRGSARGSRSGVGRSGSGY
jgi:hypothetical protein